MKKIYLYLGIVAVLSLAACSKQGNLDMVGMFYGQSPRNDVRFAESMKWNEEHGYDTLTITQDEYKVYVGTDMHVDSTNRNTLKWANMAQTDTDSPFALILGDIINATGNYPKFNEGIAPITKPRYLTAGNHDLYYGQWKEFKDYYGTSTYYFVVKTPNAKDLYICLDSGDGTLGRSQMAWFKQLLDSTDNEGYRHKIVFTHTHLWKRDSSQGHTSNFALEETYEIADVLGQHGVEWYLCGHAHSRAITDFKGCKYIITDTLQDPVEEASFMVATVGEDLSYKYVFINKE